MRTTKIKHRSREEAVGEFYTAAGIQQTDLDNDDRLTVARRLIREETEELDAELMWLLEGRGDRELLAKEMADLQYVLSALAWEFGINLEVAFNRVHASNMTKVVDGKVIRREDGKILKPATYVAPDMSGL